MQIDTHFEDAKVLTKRFLSGHKETEVRFIGSKSFNSAILASKQEGFLTPIQFALPNYLLLSILDPSDFCRRLDLLQTVS